jgi:hypothetical protein
MKLQRRWLVALTLFLSLTVVGVYAHTVFSNPAFGWRVDNSTGYVYLAKPITYLSYSINGTGGLVDFSEFTWTPTGAYWARLGFISEDLNSNTTITSITTNIITFTTNSTIIRIWSPDHGSPISTTNGSFSYDPMWAVTTVTITTPPHTVVLTWDPLPPTVDLSVYYAAFALAGIGIVIMAAVFVISIIQNPESINTGAATAILIFTLILTLGVYIFSQVAAVL